MTSGGVPTGGSVTSITSWLKAHLFLSLVPLRGDNQGNLHAEVRLLAPPPRRTTGQAHTHSSLVEQQTAILWVLGSTPSAISSGLTNSCVPNCFPLWFNFHFCTSLVHRVPRSFTTCRGSLVGKGTCIRHKHQSKPSFPPRPLWGTTGETHTRFGGSSPPPYTKMHNPASAQA